MPTVNSKKLIDELITAEGHYDGDPQALQMSSYLNQWGDTSYHIAYTPDEVFSLNTSPFCRDIKVLWRRKGKGAASKK
jgi:hypothetical protein